ncbi:SpaA isopeptide-forming pilin-related protein, partial [Schaalia sp. lx-260]|uniref:SpaA isopeptide-forming pilin-related protein n=1 Tax=Schaalia sp. lx-260 TaxID=2899082 RepID=UPI001E42D58B
DTSGGVPEGAQAAYVSAPSGVDGVATFSSVAYGDYVLREKSAPDHYVLSDQTRDVQVRVHGQTVQVGDYPNRLVQGSIKVKKLGEQADAGAENVPLVGVVFSLFAKTEGVVSDTAFATATTGADGVAVFERVPYGSYVVRETGPLAAYNPSVEAQGREVSVTGAGELVDLTNSAFVNTMKRGSIKVKKVDAEDASVPLAGVVFSLFAKTGAGVSETPFATAKTGADGVASFEGVPYGDYELRESASLVNYVLNAAWKQDVSVREDGQDVDLRSVPVTNQLIRGTVTVTKVDADTRAPLAGAIFELVDAQGSVVGEQTSASDGVASFERVPFGEYTLREKSAPVGYVRSVEVKSLSVSAHGARVALGEFPNSVMRGSVTLTKVDGVDGRHLAGAVFSLFAKSADGVSESAFDTRTSAPDGSVVFERVPYGEYVLREVQAPEGYVGDQDDREVRIDRDGQVVGFDFITNRKISGSITLTKVDADTRAPLAGAVFELVNSEGALVTEATSGHDGVVRFSGIAYGKYTVREKNAPRGYVLSSVTPSASIETDGQTLSLADYANTIIRGTVRVKKVDAEDASVPLAGVVFSLFAKTGAGVSETPFATAKTGADGVASFEGVPYGDYELRESASLVNYVLNSAWKQDVSVREDGQDVDLRSVPVTNQLIRGTVKVKKLGEQADPAAESVPLEGVVFSLFAKTEGVVSDSAFATATTGADGVASFERVPYGTYVVRETTPLAAYNPSSEVQGREVSVTGAGELVDLTGTAFTNTMKRGTVKVKKLGEQADPAAESVPLEGVVFSLFAKTEGVVSDSAFATATTGADGVASFERVPYGTYVVRETTPLAAYNPSSEVQGREVSVTGAGELVDLTGTAFTNTMKRGTVKVKKLGEQADP